MTTKWYGKFSRKPKDLPKSEYDALCVAYGATPECVRLTQGICQRPCSLQPDGVNYTVQWDHIVPRAVGGANTANNLQPICDIENAIKQAKPDRYWESGQFFFDLKPDLTKLRPGQIEFGWKPALQLAEAMLRNNSDIYRVFLLLWWIVGSGKTISMPILCSAINYIILSNGPPGAPRIDRILILAKESALRDSIANELDTELKKFGIYPRSPEIRIIDHWDLWDQPGFVDRGDIVVSCVQQLWETERDEPRTDVQIAGILSRYAAVCIDECHFGVGQLERLARLAPRVLKFGFSNTPIDDLGDILKSFVLFSMLDYNYAADRDDSLKTLSIFQDGVEEGLYVPVKTDRYRDMTGGIEGEYKDGKHDDYASNWVWWNVATAIIRRIQELDKRGKTESPEYWFSSHALIRSANVTDAEALAKMINNFFEENRAAFPESEGWRAVTIYGGKKDGPIETRRLQHRKKVGTKQIVHPWMRAKTDKDLKRRCNADCARILIAVDMVREGINNPLCNIVGWTCPSASLIELIQRIGRAMRSIPDMDRGILKRHQSVHLFWHECLAETGQQIERAIEWMLDMKLAAGGMATLDALLADGNVETEMEPGSVESVLTPDDKSRLEHATGTAILTGAGEGDIEKVVDIVVRGKDVLKNPVSGERKKRAREFIKSIMSNPKDKDRRVGVRDRIKPLTIVSYDKAKESYTEGDLFFFIESQVRDGNMKEAAANFYKENFFAQNWIREQLSHEKSKHDSIFSIGLPPTTQSIVGGGSVINEISTIFLNRLKGLVVPNDQKSSLGFLIPYVTRAAHVVLGAKKITNKGFFDRSEYHTALRRPRVEQTMFDLVRLELMIDGHLPTVRALYEEQIKSRKAAGLTLSDFEKELEAVMTDDEKA